MTESVANKALTAAIGAAAAIADASLQAVDGVKDLAAHAASSGVKIGDQTAEDVIQEARGLLAEAAQKLQGLADSVS